MTFGRNIHSTLRIEFACFSFRIGLLFFINFSSFKPDTENNASFDSVSSKRTDLDEVQFLNIYLSSIIFGTHRA